MIKKIVTSVQFWISLAVLTVTILTFSTGVLSLPDEVKSVKSETKENKKGLEKLADTVDDYIQAQKIQQESADKREQLMLELIKMSKEKSSNIDG